MIHIEIKLRLQNNLNTFMTGRVHPSRGSIISFIHSYFLEDYILLLTGVSLNSWNNSKRRTKYSTCMMQGIARGCKADKHI